MTSKTLKITQAAIMIALASVLSTFAVFKLPNGGAVTIASMAPIILFSLLYDFKWGIFASVAYALVQMVLGFYPPPTQNFVSFCLVIMLDYILAFGVLGLAGTFAKKSKNKVVGATIATFIVVMLRFLCHFFSGIIIWGSYAPEGQPVWIYSLLYNGSYMLLELVITTIVISVLSGFLDFDMLKGKKTN